VSITKISYLGWEEAYSLSNAAVTAVVVPSIGRIVDFRRNGAASSPLWLNPELLGQPADADSAEWKNFGGDKTWPAPQKEWGAVTGCDWPPPAAFDSLPLQVEVGDASLTLTSPVDGHYGIETVRHIELDPLLPVLRVRTEFRKLRCAPVKVGVWVVTQLRNPVKAFILLPEKPELEGGYKRECGIVPKALTLDGRLLSLERDEKVVAKIGTEGTRILWVGEEETLLVETEPEAGEFNFPLCQTEVYTNFDPLDYIEVETQGAFSSLGVGDTIAKTNTYTLAPRREADPTAEARRAFGV
jgi:hypothetical protein